MLNLPDNLTSTAFLEEYWQKQALFMPRAMHRLHPSISRNELAWLATHDDVESRIVFVEGNESSRRYRVETGPFTDTRLQNLPKRDWTLLVHDVEKHIPAMRTLFQAVPFIPDWRIDDLMVSFAAPGGGVGPHCDNYDVFLCQGIGIRHWHFAGSEITPNPAASNDLALLQEFGGTEVDAVEGDILYLPPGVAHWGTAKRACLTYSIGMRAPEDAELAHALQLASPDAAAFYRDPDLQLDEALPGYISTLATIRAAKLMGTPPDRDSDIAIALGRFATQNKDWLRPEGQSPDVAKSWLAVILSGARVNVHGMARLAFDERYVYANGEHFELSTADRGLTQNLCAARGLARCGRRNPEQAPLIAFLLAQGAFEIPENP